MSCPTCDHTMQKASAFWCPRCGTLREVGFLGPDGWRSPHCKDTIPTNRDDLSFHARQLAEHVAGEPHVTTVEIKNVALRVLELTKEPKAKP